MKQKYAEDLPYWKTGKSADRAIEEAKNAIGKHGGKLTGEGFGMMNGEAAYFLQFKMHDDEFRVVEPVMKSATGNEKAARIQAAASLKHSIKARVNEAVRHGARRAFMSSLLLPNGKVLNDASNQTLQNLFGNVSGVKLLNSGEIEGEWEQVTTT